MTISNLSQRANSWVNVNHRVLFIEHFSSPLHVTLLCLFFAFAVYYFLAPIHVCHNALVPLEIQVHGLLHILFFGLHT